MTSEKGETSLDFDGENLKIEEVECEVEDSKTLEGEMGVKIENDLEDAKSEVKPEPMEVEKEMGKIEFDVIKPEITESTKEEVKKPEIVENEKSPSKRGRKRKMSVPNGENESVEASNASIEDAKMVEEALETDFDDEEEIENKPRRRGRCKKNPDIIPPHLSSDIVLGYKILLKFLETPQFSGFHKPFNGNTTAEDSQITCLNQIKKKFEDNTYKKVCEFVNDVREMLTNIYESRNTVAIKRALRLEQVLEQRIAQLPNYLRPQCALILSPDEVNNSHNKIRISKGGGFVSLLLEKAEKRRSEKDREKRKLLAEERKQLKEEQDKDVQEWEKNVLLKDFEEEIKSMWELPAIGHFIHLCADILNIGEVAQFEVERMLLMPQCSDTLDLIMTALLTNSLVRAKLDRTPSMPYSIWGPLVRTRVLSWYRTWHREGRNEQKLFEEIGIEPEFWQIVGPDINPLDYYYFHELSLLQRVWILKTLCDVDFVRKKTVHDNIRAQTLDELNPVHLGVDRHGNRYIQLKQFCGSDMRIYRQSTKLEGDITPSELIESSEGFEHREGPITTDKVFRDIWELGEKSNVKVRKKKAKAKRARSYVRVVPEPAEKKNLRQSARAKQKTYVDWSDSDQSDTDLATLKTKLTRPDTETLYRPFSDKEFISLSVFRLPRDKVTRPTSKRSSYVSRRQEDSVKNEGTTGDKNVKTEPEDRKEEAKPSGCDEEQSDSLDAKQMQDIQTDFEKSFQCDDMNGDEFDLGGKISNCKLDKSNSSVKFTVKNLEDLKMVLKKGSAGEEASVKVETEKSDAETNEDTKTEDNANSLEKQYDSLYKYNVPNHLKPDSTKFYLVVDSVEGLRQLISKFGSHENDLEIISRSTKSNKKNSPTNTSCEVQLIERLQNLLLELEPWELDLMKSSRSNREKMYKEYMNFINRPTDFVHPNESYWMKTYEEPTPTTATATNTTTTTTTTTTSTADGSSGTGDKNSGKEANAGESPDVNQQNNAVEELVPRKRTRVTRLQYPPATDGDDLDGEFEDGDDYESNESDDNWVLPTSKRKSKRESAVKTPKFPRRSAGRKPKSSPLEKTDSHEKPTEKSQSSSPEKVKKALFWGPRSSDPSEDLNWETNRQKILEQHNSPTKKVLFKADEIVDDMAELEKALKNPPKSENSTPSVITASPKRFTAQIPGNKKPYFSSAQLKAMESQEKLEKSIESSTKLGPKFSAKPEVRSAASTTGSEATSVGESGNKTPVKIQTYSRFNKAVPKQSSIRSPQSVNRPRQPPPKSVTPGNRVDATSVNYQQPVKFVPQIKGQTQRPGAPVQTTNQIVEVQRADGSGVIQQKSVGQVQIQQPINRVQQIQIQQPSGQVSQNWMIATSVADVRMQQPMQWQPKVIAVQSLNQSGKIIQQQVQAQAQVEGQPQVQLQNQPQVVQGQIQQVIHLEPQKLTTVQQSGQAPAEKLMAVQQRVVAQPQTSNSLSDPDNNFYITDGKLLIKIDNNFVSQHLQKDKVLALNVNDKLDLKKSLFIVKPKTESSVSTSVSQGEPSTSQQNILVLNKPTTVQQQQQQQTTAPSSVSSFVIPGSYIIKEGNQVQGQGEQQTVKIVQQAPTYVIQQKQVGNKGPQPQIIKIITSQPMATNQNLILSPANVSVTNQVIRPVNQSATSTDQQNQAPTTLRFIRPKIAASTSPTAVQNKINTVQGSIIVNNLVQVQGQRMEVQKSQNSILAGRIVSTSVPAVRMTTPVQAQTTVSSSGANPQGARLLTSGNNAQPMRVATSSQIQQVQTQTIVPTSNLNQTVRLATNVNVQPVRMVSNPQPQVVHSQSVVSSASLNPQVVRSVANLNAQPVRISQPQVQTQTFVSAGNLNTQTVRFVASQPPRMATNVQSQTVVSSGGNMNHQVVRFVTSSNLQPPRMTTSVQSVVSSATPNSQFVRSASNANAQSVRMVQAQPVHTQTIVSSSSLNTQPVRIATSSGNLQTVRTAMAQPQQIQTQTVVLSPSANPQVVRQVGATNVQPVRIAQPQLLTQAVVASTSLNPQSVRTVTSLGAQPVRLATSGQQPIRLLTNNSGAVRFVSRNVTPSTSTVITSVTQSPGVVPNAKPTGIPGQPVRLQPVVQAASGVKPVQNRFQLTPNKKKIVANTLPNAPIIIKLEDDEDEIRIVEEKIAETPVTVDYIHGELSVKKTSQGWKYAVKASNGQDVILTDEQIEERREANNGVMK